MNYYWHTCLIYNSVAPIFIYVSLSIDDYKSETNPPSLNSPLQKNSKSNILFSHNHYHGHRIRIKDSYFWIFPLLYMNSLFKEEKMPIFYNRCLECLIISNYFNAYHNIRIQWEFWNLLRSIQKSNGFVEYKPGLENE